MSSKVSSFDVFDTVLTRLVGEPTSLFWLLGSRAITQGNWPHSIESFVLARIAAERTVRIRSHPHEVTLSAIYTEIAFRYGLSTDTIVACSVLEVDLETAVLRAIPETTDIVKMNREADCEIIFISDTYFPLVNVRRWLIDCGVATDSDKIVTSSEVGLTKLSGMLFDYLLEKRSSKSAWLHLGDNKISDVVMPRSRNIQAEEWKGSKLNRYENILQEHSTATSGLAALLAGASRWVRLSHNSKACEENTMRTLAAGVAGPILWAFVTWVIKSAQKDGLRRLWFTARDGQIMLKIAKIIAPTLGADLEMGYLYASRQSLHLAGLHQIDERALSWLTGGAGVVTAAALLQRVALDVDDVREILLQYGIPTEGKIGWEYATQLRAFFSDANVRNRILAISAQRRREMRSYFEACGVIGGECCGLVDIGWRGNVLKSLFDVVGSLDASRHKYYYFGLFGRPAEAPDGSMSAYCFDASRRPPLGLGFDIPCITSVMEIFCQADHPQVLHVQEINGEFVPIYQNDPPRIPSLWSIPYFQECVVSFAEAVRGELAHDVEADLRPAIESLLRKLIESPERCEAVVLGNNPFVDDQAGTTAQRFAKPYTYKDLYATARDGHLPFHALAWWEQGALNVTPKSLRRLLKFAKSAHRRMPYLKSLIKKLRKS